MNGVVTKTVDGQEYRFAWNKFGAWLVRDDRSAAEPTARFSTLPVGVAEIFGCEDGNEKIVETTFIAAVRAKHAVNEGRDWPDWRTLSQDQAIEHIR